MIEIRVDKKAIRRAEKLLRNIPNGTQKAIVNATNRALTKGRMVVNRGITSRFTIKATQVKESLSIQKASFSRLGGLVKSNAPVTELSRFKVTPNKVTKKKPNTLKVDVKKSGFKAIPHAFIMQTKSGHTGVFERIGKARTPVKQLMGPSIPYMAKDPQIASDVQKEMVNMFNSRLDHEVKRLLKK